MATFRSAATAANGAAPTSLTVTKPAGVVDTDVMVAFVVISADQTINVAPVGWTLLDSKNTGVAAGDCRHYVYYRVASSEGANYLWGFTAGADCAAVILAYSGVNATPINVAGSRLMASSTLTHVAPSVLPTSANTVTITAFGVNPFINGDTTFTTPAGLTAEGEADPGAGTTNRAVVKVFDASTPTAVATGDQTTTVSNSAKGVAFTVTLSPLVAADISLTVQPYRVVPTATGCMLGWYDQNGYTGTNGLQDMETILQTRFAIVRVYNQWWPDVSGTVAAAMGDNRMVMTSHKPPKRANSWVEIAAGTHDSEITSMINFYKAFAPKKVIFVFNHEPHASASDVGSKSPSYGTIADFVRAFRHISQMFKAASATNVAIGYCAVDSRANDYPHDPGYPGDDVVDVLCHDIYNWGGYSPGPWKDPSALFTEFVTLAKTVNKPIIFGEVGCHPDIGAHHRGQWFQDLATFFRTGDAATYVLGFCYYHVDNHDNSGNYFRFAQGAFPDGITGYTTGFSQSSTSLTTPIPPSLQETLPPPGGGTTNVVLSGIASNFAFGSPTMALAGGVFTLTSVGNIPSPADYEDPEESPGLDFGTLTVTVDPPLSGTYTFQPPVVYDVSPLTDDLLPIPNFPRGTPKQRFYSHMRSRPRGRTVILLKTGAAFATDWPAQMVPSPPEPGDPFTESGLAGYSYTEIARVFMGGHIEDVNSQEANWLAVAGFGGGLTPTTPDTSFGAQGFGDGAFGG